MESACPRIRALPLPLANQIAAGEVVERPASVVKELLENSLDAGARRIAVEVEAGGTRLIRVRDDGHGIHREDLPLAVGRHATSKIARPEDLAAIASLGFRGEALASIAAVSRLSLSSARAGESAGWTLSVDPARGEPAEVQPAAHPPGTTVEVRDLFHNTPARRKFLRTDKTEFAHIDELIRRLALSHFDTALVLQHNRREVHNLPVAADRAGRERRLARLCGSGFVQGARGIDFEAAGLRLWGWIGGPDYSRGQADLQYFYVNGRIIRDRLIAHALRQAYQGRLYPGRHAAYVLHLAIEPAAVDVNVHPTKHEVRFRQARHVHDFLVSRVTEALGGDAGDDGRDDAGRDVAGAPAGGGRRHLSPAGGWGAREAAAHYAALRAGPAEPAAGGGPLGEPVAVLHGTYLLCRSGQGPLLVDIPAAQRFLARRALAAGLAGGAVRSQPLLVPARVSVGARQAERAMSLQGPLAALGLELDRVGPAELLVRAVPAALSGIGSFAADAPRWQDLFAALASLEQGQGGADEPAPSGQAIAAVLAAEAAVPAERLSARERESLLRALEAQDPPGGRDEQGRRLWAPLPAERLGRLFD